ncbi:MAG: hypothetical protein J6X66_05755 [Lachnospiraceae bacterium]|nr:hypothetical protein [Lachnospiraceae bacterium]
MENSIRMRNIAAVLILSLICFACIYGEYLFLIGQNGRTVDMSEISGLLLLSLLTVPCIILIFILINLAGKWYRRTEVCGTIFFSLLLLIVLLLFVLPAIEPPYELIPRGEMALSYGQMIIQIFTVVPAVICAGVSGILYLVFRPREDN